MRATDIERLDYAIPVRPSAESGWNFGSLRLLSGAGFEIEITRSQESKGDKHAHKV
jgi:hypothetical protein